MLGNLPSRKNPWNSVWQAPLNTELKTTSGHRILVLWRENRHVELGEDAPDNQTTIRSWTAFLRKDEYSEIGYCKLVQSNICGSFSFSFIDSHPKKKFIDHSFSYNQIWLPLSKNDHYLPRKRKRYKKEPFKLYSAHHGESSPRLDCNPRERAGPR